MQAPREEFHPKNSLAPHEALRSCPRIRATGAVDRCLNSHEMATQNSPGLQATDCGRARLEGSRFLPLPYPSHDRAKNHGATRRRVGRRLPGTSPRVNYLSGVRSFGSNEDATGWGDISGRSREPPTKTRW